MRNLLQYLMAIVLPVLLSSCTGNEEAEKYKPTWESLQQYECPAWFRDAKFGIFIHWGPQGIPDANARGMYQEYKTRWNGEVLDEKNSFQQRQIEKYGPLKDFGYKDFIPMFKAEKWDPDAWVDLFARAGAKYVIPVADHHDGFAMYASTQTKWNALEMGPKRDVLGEMKKAIEKKGLHFGASSHYAYNWHYYTYREDYDTWDPENYGLYNRPHEWGVPADKEFLDYWYLRTWEIVDKYHPEILWFDFGFNQPEYTEYRKRMAADYYNAAMDWGKEVVLNYKKIDYEAYPDGTAVLDLETGKLDHLRQLPWQTDTHLGANWFYTGEGKKLKSPDRLLDDLVDIVSKNGNLLLNVGPRPDGTIPQGQQDLLLEIGSWLEMNGEAIYGTRPWLVYGEGPTKVHVGDHSEGKNEAFTAEDIRFTTKGDTLYAIVLDWPGEELLIQSLASDLTLYNGKIGEIRMTGLDIPLDWSAGKDGLKVIMPDKKPGKFAFVLKIIPE